MAEAAIAVAEKHGFGNWIALGRSVRGSVLAETGETAKGISELEANVALVLGDFQMQIAAMLAQAYRCASRADLAVGTLDEALARGKRGGLHIYDAELHRLKGEVILMRELPAATKAEACFRRGIEIAKGQPAKWWELRATTSLARLLRDTGRSDEARTMLGDIYNWFTEGFDTADLKDAEALLEEPRA